MKHKKGTEKKIKTENLKPQPRTRELRDLKPKKDPKGSAHNGGRSGYQRP
ncbi:MAG TPA: hypothetical protein VFX07_13350 [Candidatus Udaeobacter sp.]|jgi:hypothetical protein|nr:hypothetical protein [Candidatus Udaeobacter sp.]